MGCTTKDDTSRSFQMIFIWLLVCLIIEAKTASQDRKQVPSLYDGAKVLRVYTMKKSHDALIRLLEDTQKIHVWKSLDNYGTLDIMVNSSSANNVKNMLRNMKIPHKIMIDDIEEMIKEENSAKLRRKATKLARASSNLDLTTYNKLGDIYDYLEYLAQTYSSICTVQDIGTSELGNPIKMLKISGSTRTAKHSIIIEGGIHAREWISPACVLCIINELVENRAQHAFAASVDIYVVPVTNPDGYEYSHTTDRMWRKNRRDAESPCPGVDLNRNFDYEWGGTKASDRKCDVIYCGEYAFSEPETQAIRNLVSKIGSSAKAYLAFHSYGQRIVYPKEFDAELDAMGIKIAENIKTATGYSYTVGHSDISGVSKGWAKDVANIKYSYTIELRDKGNTGFILPETQIAPTCKEAFAVIETIAEEVISRG